MLLNVIGISGAVHLLALLILGGITIVKYVIPDEAAFEEPPAIEEEKPPPPVKVEIKQRPAQLDQSLANLRMKQVGNIAVANVAVDLPSMQESFTVSAGLGGFRSNSVLAATRGSLNMGMSDVSVFGLKARAERIIFFIDAGAHMMTDDKGGLHSYRIIKKEITNMVANLSAGTLFNVVLYDFRHTRFFRPKLVPAGNDSATQLENWLKPINEQANKVGLPNDPIRPLKPLEGENVMAEALKTYRDPGNITYYLTHLAMEQSVDTVFFITGRPTGADQIRRQMTKRERAIWDKHASSKKYQEALRKHQQEIPKVEKAIRQKVKEINAQRKKQGLPNIVLRHDDPRYNARKVGISFKHRHPGWATPYYLEGGEIRSYFRRLGEALYEDRGQEPPSVNAVVFLGKNEELNDEQKEQLRRFTRFFGGRDRILAGGKAIRMASSAAETTNN